RCDLLAGDVRDLLDHTHELDLEPARQVEVVVVFEDVRDAALARLAVDPDDRLVGPPYVVRVDGQVGHVPDLAVRVRSRLHALLDRILVRARKCGVGQLADVGVPRVYGQLVAGLDHAPQLVDVGDVEPRVDPLAEEVHCHGHEVDIARALAVAEQRALDAFGAGHQGQLRRAHRAP